MYRYEFTIYSAREDFHEAYFADSQEEATAMMEADYASYGEGFIKSWSCREVIV